MTVRLRSVLVRLVCSILFLAPPLLVTGCGGSTAPVSGTVTLNGAPLTGGGTVTFQGSGGGASGVINPDGTYTIPNAPVGEVHVAVVPGRGPAAGVTITPPPDVSEMKPPQALAPAWTPPAAVSIPLKYADPNTSGLTYTVTRGEQTIDVTLTP
jgi:hypothetical protein